MPEVIEVQTECGHVLKMPYSLEEMLGATVDCTVCGKLLMLQVALVKGVDFHKELNRRNPDWPADGAGTGWVEV